MMAGGSLDNWGAFSAVGVPPDNVSTSKATNADADHDVNKQYNRYLVPYNERGLISPMPMAGTSPR